jgi:hypothetical protein
VTEIERPALDGIVIPPEPTIDQLLARQTPQMRRWYEKFLAGEPLPPTPPLTDEEHAAISESLIAHIAEGWGQ